MHSASMGDRLTPAPKTHPGKMALNTRTGQQRLADVGFPRSATATHYRERSRRTAPGTRLYLPRPRGAVPAHRQPPTGIHHPHQREPGVGGGPVGCGALNGWNVIDRYRPTAGMLARAGAKRRTVTPGPEGASPVQSPGR
jgi:hypothetical protein